MNPHREKTKEQIAVMQAYVDGAEIEVLWAPEQWHVCRPGWSWIDTKYRVRAKPREWWVVVSGASRWLCNTREAAERDVASLEKYLPTQIVHLREVLDE
jgi:hypothetical protein